MAGTHRGWARTTVLVCMALGLACDRAAPTPPPAPTLTLDAESVARPEVRALESGPQLSGTLSPRREATLRSEVSGPVHTVKVETGAKVKKGELLAEIGDITLQEAAQSARTAVAAAHSELHAAQAEEARTRRLADAGAIARRDLDVAIANTAAREAQLAQAQAQRANAENALRRSFVRAPFDGVVSDRNVSVGDVLQPGSPLFKVIDPQSLRLEASVPIETAAKISPGTPVGFAVSGYPGRRFEAKVLAVNPAVDPNTRQVRLTIELPNDAGVLLAGVYAEGRVVTARREALSLPTDAVRERGTQPTVLAIRDGKVKQVPVTVGMHDPVADQVEITSGVKAGDQVLRAAAGDLADGTQVKVKPPQAAPKPGVGGSGQTGD